jgi:O-antigen/teichoic acid export membrane protein
MTERSAARRPARTASSTPAGPATPAASSPGVAGSPRETEPPPRTRLRGQLMGNVAGRLSALAALAIATIMVARMGGPTLVGIFTLLRVLTGLACVLAVCGLPGASPYFLARGAAEQPRVRSTLGLVTIAGAAAGGLGWLALTPLLHMTVLRHSSVTLIAAAAIPTFTQTFVSVGKSWLQGSGDMRGANAAIAAEEAAFLPVYAALLVTGHGPMLLVAALTLADVVVAAGIAVRLIRRGFFRRWIRPRLRLAAEICGYGWRGQIGGLLNLINMRLDVVLLGLLTGNDVVGIYSVASKYSELLQLPGLTGTYVLYPQFARQGRAAAGRRAGALLLPALVLTVVAAVPLALLTGPSLPVVFGASFKTALTPALILIVGMLGQGVGGIVTAYLFGVGRPGANSIAQGLGVVMTVILDVLLIPPYGAIGAAVASTIAYTVTTVALTVWFFCLRGRERRCDRDT